VVHRDWRANPYLAGKYIWSVAFSPDGRNIVSGSADTAIPALVRREGISLCRSDCNSGPTRIAVAALADVARCLAGLRRKRHQHAALLPHWHKTLAAARALQSPAARVEHEIVGPE
jgi:hypothetical protein